MKKKILATLLVFGLAATTLIGCSNPTSYSNPTGCSNPTGVETTKDNNIEKIYNSDIYEFIDPDTGVHYWIYSHKAGYGGMGGMTPRLNPDGTVMITE